METGFLLFALELVLSKYFRALSMGATATRDLTTPQKCATHLKEVLKDFSTFVDTPEKLSKELAWFKLCRSGECSRDPT